MEHKEREMRTEEDNSLNNEQEWRKQKKNTREQRWKDKNKAMRKGIKKTWGMQTKTVAKLDENWENRIKQSWERLKSAEAAKFSWLVLGRTLVRTWAGIPPVLTAYERGFPQSHYATAEILHLIMSVQFTARLFYPAAKQSAPFRDGSRTCDLPNTRITKNEIKSRLMRSSCCL
jgi:hypothetical protein